MSFEACRNKWAGAVAGRRVETTFHLRLDAVLESQSDSRGGSLPFKGLATDGEIYWIKMRSNWQSDRVPATEQIISGAGQLIGAPVCESVLLEIPKDFEGERLDNGTVLHSGVVHASRDVGVCAFKKWHEPEFRLQDDNRRRHGGYFALYDWCWGDDMQWLYDLNDDRKTYSHDHGHFLPGAPDWTERTLADSVDVPHELQADGAGLDDTELLAIAARLDSLTQTQLAEVLARIPLEWPVSDQELEFVGAFLDHRRSPVAIRLRTLADQLQNAL